MDFRAATDRVAGCITHVELAKMLGVSPQTVRTARLHPESPNYRNPPPGWEAALAKLARKRGGELVKLAEQLDREATA
jgi:hypothetical protein